MTAPTKPSVSREEMLKLLDEHMAELKDSLDDERKYPDSLALPSMEWEHEGWKAIRALIESCGDNPQVESSAHSGGTSNDKSSPSKCPGGVGSPGMTDELALDIVINFIYGHSEGCNNPVVDHALAHIKARLAGRKATREWIDRFAIYVGGYAFAAGDPPGTIPEEVVDMLREQGIIVEPDQGNKNSQEEK
jgi:hypothetical protein